jgi:catechol 2,3-dioxygenase-like lactoylglutathione lyase family enzyme
MLKKAKVARATIPASDLDRARAFYSDKLGLELSDETDPTGLIYSLPNGGSILVFKSSGQASGTHTQLGFDVDDVEAEIAELKTRGVRFEEYDSPGFKTVNGIATIEGGKGGWFKDSEGNLLSVFQRVGAGVPS